MTLRPLAFLATIAGVASAQARVTTGTVLVSNQQAASATIVDVATHATTNLDVGTGPHEAVVSPDGKWGIATIYGVGGAPGNKLAVIDLAAKKVVRTVDLGQYTRPHGATFIPGSPNTVIVTSETTANLVLVDIVKGEVIAAIPTRHQGTHMVGVTADGKRAYTASIPFGGIIEVDLEKRAFVRDLAVSTTTEGVAVSPDGNSVWLGSNDKKTVSVIDTKSWSVAATLTGFEFPYRIAISPNSALAVICDAMGNKIHIADVKTRKVIGEVGSLASPRGVYIAPDNRTVFVTLAGEDAVAAVDLIDKTVLWKAPVARAPDGVWYGPIAK